MKKITPFFVTLLPEFIAAISAGSIIGMLGLVLGANYGGNYGCFPFINALFGTRGYESCGSFFALLGIILGALLGVYLVKKYSRDAMKTIFTSVLILILVPLLFEITQGLEDIGVTMLLVLIFVVFSFIPSAIIVALMNIKKLKKK